MGSNAGENGHAPQIIMLLIIVNNKQECKINKHIIIMKRIEEIGQATYMQQELQTQHFQPIYQPAKYGNFL